MSVEKVKCLSASGKVHVSVVHRKSATYISIRVKNIASGSFARVYVCCVHIFGHLLVCLSLCPRVRSITKSAETGFCG